MRDSSDFWLIVQGTAVPNLKANSFWFTQESTWYTEKVLDILKFQFACNYSVNLNFDI